MPAQSREWRAAVDEDGHYSFAARAKPRTGAPRSMKMGTTRLPWRYDAATRRAFRPALPRRPALLHDARRGPPDIAERSGWPSIAAMPNTAAIDAMLL
jgi:hypothetical protein